MNIMFQKRNDGMKAKLAFFWTLKVVAYILMSIFMAVVLKMMLFPCVSIPRTAIVLLVFKFFIEFRMKCRCIE